MTTFAQLLSWSHYLKNETPVTQTTKINGISPTTFRIAFTAASFLILVCCFLGCNSRKSPALDLATSSWQDVLDRAKGTTVTMAMWDGDPLINAYMNGYVRSKLKELYDIDLQLVGGHGNELVQKLKVELDTGRTEGDIDVMWINGQTFYQLRELKALYGPFTNKLPNNGLIDWENRFIGKDFQQAVDGYECPWGNVQFALIYAPDRVATLPQTKDELARWIHQNPGRFTFDTGFTGMTFLKCLLIDFADNKEAFQGTFDEHQYEIARSKLWNYLHELKPYLWQKGESFPENVAQLHRLFVNNEIDFTMSNNDGEVDNKAAEGIIPATSKAYVLQSGTIRNSHYLGIPINSPNKTAALVLTNFLISPEAQLEKSLPDRWGDGTVLSLSKLTPEYRDRFQNIPGRIRIPSREQLEPFALEEPAPQVMIRLYEDFRKNILESR
jgi:putative spermidine/putrescine transport system substrate-binding protein